MALLIEFEKPQHGWLPFVIQVGTVRVEEAASDVANSPLTELASAAKGLLLGESPRYVHFWHEPHTTIVEFSRESDGSLTTRLFQHGDTMLKGAGGDLLAESNTTIVEAIKTIVRSLERLCSDPAFSSAESNWDHEAPLGLMREIRDLLRPA